MPGAGAWGGPRPAAGLAPADPATRSVAIDRVMRRRKRKPTARQILKTPVLPDPTTAENAPVSEGYFA